MLSMPHDSSSRCAPCLPLCVYLAGLLPGFYASGSNNGALTASLCPMGWICPGSAPGDTTPVAVLIFTLPSNSPVPNLTSGDASAGRVVSCADAFRTRTQSGAFFTSSRRLLGLWTRQLGSTNSSECREYDDTRMHVRHGCMLCHSRLL